MRMKWSVYALCLLLGLFLTGCGGPDALELSFVNFQSAEHGFTVDMPGIPQETFEKIEAFMGPTASYSGKINLQHTTFAVEYEDHGNAASDDPEGFLDTALTGGPHRSGRRIIESKAISMGSLPGREYEMESKVQPERVVYGRLIVSRGRLYDAYIETNRGIVAEEDVRRFLESFQVVEN